MKESFALKVNIFLKIFFAFLIIIIIHRYCFSLTSNLLTLLKCNAEKLEILKWQFKIKRENCLKKI